MEKKRNEFVPYFVKNYLLNEKYDKNFIYNFDETGISRDSTGRYTIAQKGTKHIIIKTAGKTK